MTRPIDVRYELNGNPKNGCDLIGNDDNYNDTIYTCDMCGKKFNRKSSLTIHVNSHYLKNKQEGDKSQEESKKNTCNLCNKNFTAKKNLLKHLRKVHKNYNEADKMKIKKLKCPEKDCDFVCRLMSELREHICRFHKIKIFRDVLEFHNNEAFQKWKKDEENVAMAMFVTGRMKTSLINGCKKQTLHCHRTGQYSPKGYGKYRTTHLLNYRYSRFMVSTGVTSGMSHILKKMDLMRTIGSCKIGVTCPAAMETTESPTGQINVIYYKTHLGHEQDVAHLKLTRDERAQLAKKIEQGFSLDAILEDVREYSDLHSTKTKRMDLLSKKDLYSIMRTVNNNIVKKLKRRDEEKKRQEEARAKSQSRSQSRSQLQPVPQPQPQAQPEPQPLPQEGPILIQTVENQENFPNENFEQDFAFYSAPSVVVPQEAVYLEPQPNFVTYQRVEDNPVPVSVPVGVSQVPGEEVAPQVMILPPEMNYGSVAEIVLVSPEQGPSQPPPSPPPPPPSLTVFPQNTAIQEPQPPEMPPPPPPPPPPQPQPRPVPREEMTLEEMNKANRPNLRLQIQEKIDKIVELLPDSEYLTPKQFALINAKLNRVLDIYTQVSARAKLKKQPVKKRILKKVEYDGNWRNNADVEPRVNENYENWTYGRETVMPQPIYETPVLYAVYN